MALRSQYEFLFVGRDEGSFVENYAYDLGEGNEQSGKIFINLEIQNNLADAEMIGEVIFDTIRKAFFSDLEKDSYVRFEEALKQVNKALTDLKNEKASRYIGQLNVVIAVIVGEDLFLTQCGEAEAYLVRRRFCSTVSEGLAEDSKDTFTNIASGTLEIGDFVLLSSTQLLRYITKTDLAKIAGQKNLVTSLGELREFLANEVGGRTGFIGIALGQGAAEFLPKEQVKMMAHLQKEEEYEENGISQHGKMNVMVSDFGRQVSTFFSSMKDRLTGMKALSQRGKIVRSGTNKSSAEMWFGGRWSKDQILGMLIVVILVLTTGIWWLRSRAEEQDKINRYAATLNEVQQQIGSAETTGQYDKEKAAETLNDAEQKALEVLNSGFNRSKANELLSTIKQERDKLDGVTRVTPKVLVDLSQKRPNVSALGLLASKNNLFAFEYNALYPILLDKIQDPVSFDEGDTVISATPFDDKDSLLFFTKEGRVLEYKDGRITSVASAENAYHKGYAVQAYGNKLYVLDPAGNQIWRYTRRRDQFDTAEKYNVDGDLTKAVSFAIDGSIYVLNNDGSLVKLLSGNKQNLVIKKTPVNPLTAPTKIFTQLDMSQIYILEPSTHRVLVLYKDESSGALVYSNQYIFEDINDVRDLYVDKNTKKMYLMDQSKVYQVDL